MKQLLDEEYVGGFRTGRYSDRVCSYCISDPALAVFVSRNGPIRHCDFCGRTDTLGMQVGSLFHYMAACLHAEWDDPNNAMAWEGGWFVQGPRIVDSYDLLEELGLPLENEALQWGFVDAFDHLWCQRDPYRLDHSDMLFRSWRRFSKLTKADKRNGGNQPWVSADTGHDELLSPAEVPDAINRAIARTNWRMLKQDRDLRFVRARAHCPSEGLRTATKLGSPPPRYAGSNRMSAAGTSMFYAAESETTAIDEIRPHPEEAVTTASWTPSRELVYVDLPAAQPIPSIFDMTARGDRPWLRFLAEFATDLARRVDAHSDPAEYAPTQTMTQYIRDHLRSRDNRPVDGIRYHSSVDKPDGVCWVVFATQDDCGDSATTPDRLLMLDPDSVRTATRTRPNPIGP